MTETWSCPHGTEYSGSADFISGAKSAHEEFYGLGICRECHGTKRIKVKGFTDGLPRGTGCCPACARAALAAPTKEDTDE